MYYSVPIQPAVIVSELYTLQRNTVWRCTDERNILVYIKNGCCYFTIDSQKQLLSKGSFILIPANTAYTREHYNNTYCEMMYFHYITPTPIQPLSDTEALEMIRNQIRTEESITLSDINNYSEINSSLCLTQVIDMESKSETVQKLLKRIVSGYQNSLHYNVLRRSLRFTDMLSYLGTKCIETTLSSKLPAQQETSSQMPPQLQKAIFYIRQNYKNQITIDDLCTVANVSPQHLIRLFNKHLQTTPIKYINHLRILNSIELLRTSNLSIKEISNELGFENQNYFNRLFRKEENMTPGEKRDYIQNFSEDTKQKDNQ